MKSVAVAVAVAVAIAIAAELRCHLVYSSQIVTLPAITTLMLLLNLIDMLMLPRLDERVIVRQSRGQYNTVVMILEKMN